MLVLYRGRRGTGKTLTLVKDGFKLFKYNWPIYSNFYTNFSKKLEFESLTDLKNCVILLDEAQLFFDSRDFIKQKNKDFSYFIQQIRKRNIILLMTTQYANTIDIRIRQNIDILCYPTFDKEFNLIKANYYDLTKLEDGKTNELMPYTMYFKATPFFNMYKTKEILK